MTLPAAVLFDLDGVIVDSEGVWDAVRREIAAGHGLPWPTSATLEMMGMSSPEWSRYMRDVVGVPASAEDINGQVVDGVIAAYADGPPFITGARTAVGRMARRFRLGLASSSNREVIDEVLAGGGLFELFEATVSSEEVGPGKPAPDVYLEAAARLGVDARACVAIEDSSNGVRSAAAAGCAVICIPRRAAPPAADALALAAAVLPSIGALWPTVVRASATRGV